MKVEGWRDKAVKEEPENWRGTNQNHR